MAKKIVLGALLVGLVAVLVAGAVIRTNAKTGDSAEGAGRYSRASEVAATGAATDTARWGAGRAATGEQGGGFGRSADVQPNGADGLPAADVPPEAWVTVQGAVVSVADDLVEIETAAGELIPVEGRPLSWAQEQGFTVRVGDQVAVMGFDEDGEFKIGQMNNLTTGASIGLRDASGRPGWAGRGRRG